MPIGNQPSRTAVSVAVTAALVGVSSAQAQDQDRRAIEEVVVTATKVEESLQDVPIAVTALTGDDLEALGITNFADYVMQLPSVTAGGSGPGQNTIYIRGVASTTPNLTTAGVAGLAPNVAFYLDEQPLAQPGRNLDVYAADLQRIEVLSGPQGTLFGGSSQAGNVRLITNKPDLDETFGSVRVGAASITDGDASGNIELMLNLPVSETFGLRGVFYTDTKGGWIDNVAGTRDASQSARFRPEGTVRANGVPVSADRAGFQSTADLSGVTFLETDNSALVEKDINETTYTGGRISARWDISDRWRIDLAHTQQDLESDGVFFSDPDLGDLEVQRFSPDSIEDTFGNTAWTVTALFGELEVLYTGAYTDRETDQIVDYTDYLFVGQYLPYYICDGSVTYPAADPTGTCQPPNLFVDSNTEVEVFTHELRFTTDQTSNFRVTAGAFFQDLELREVNDFTYPGSVRCDRFRWRDDRLRTELSADQHRGHRHDRERRARLFQRAGSVPDRRHLPQRYRAHRRAIRRLRRSDLRLQRPVRAYGGRSLLRHRSGLRGQCEFVVPQSRRPRRFAGVRHEYLGAVCAGQHGRRAGHGIDRWRHLQGDRHLAAQRRSDVLPDRVRRLPPRPAEPAGRRAEPRGHLHGAVRAGYG